MGLSIVVVEHLPAPGRARAAPRPAASAPPAPRPEPEPVGVLEGDWLVLRLGGSAPAPPPSAKASPPQQQPAPAPPAAHDTYVVQAGDTLSRIAQRELGSARLADELARLNGIEDPTSLRPGQVLRLR